MFGKVADWTEATCQASLAPKTFWSDYTVMINKASQEGNMGVKPTCVLCQVAEGGVITWDPEGLQIAGLGSAEQATAAALKHRRRRQ